MKQNRNKKRVSLGLGLSMVATTIPAPHSIYADAPETSASSEGANTGAPTTTAPDGTANNNSTTPATPAETSTPANNTGDAAGSTSANSNNDNSSTPKAENPKPAAPATGSEGGEGTAPAEATPKEKFGAEVSFEVEKDKSLISKNDIVFKNSQDQVLDIKTIVDTTDKFDFSKIKEGEEVKYEITAPGYKKYKGTLSVKSESQKVSVNLVELETVNVNKEAIHKIYGDSSFSLKDLLGLPNDYDGSIQYEVVSGSSAVTVSSSGEVQISKPVEASIKVKADKTDNYKAFEVTIPLVVTKKNLGQINSSMIEWKSVTKVYDGKNTFEAEGELKSDTGLVGTDKITVKANLQLESANVGSQRTTIQEISYTGPTDYYQYSSELQTGPNIDVTPKDVHVSLKGFSVAYASEDWKNLTTGLVPSKVTLKDSIVLPDDVSAEDKEAISNLSLSDAFLLNAEQGLYGVGEATDKFTVTLKKEVLGNYKFIVDKNKANVTVTKDERSTNELWSNVMFDADSSKDTYVNGETIFVKPGGFISFKLKEKSVYDTLGIKATNIDGSTFGQSFIIPASTTTKDITGKFYLSNSRAAETKTDELDTPALYKVDADVPVVEFVDGSKIFASIFNAGTTTFNDADAAIKFAKTNSRTGFVVRLNSSDSGSGLKSLQYSLVKVTSDDDAKAKIREAVVNDALTWTDVSNNAIQVNPTDEGYYIVVVKAKDNVGNEALYASNGFVLDVTNPTISVTNLPDLSKIHYGGISYTVDVLDPVSNGVATGIAKVDVVVKNNGKPVPAEAGRKNSFTITANDLYGKEDLETFSDMDMAKVAKQFEGQIDVDGNNISLEITAYDKAGNKVTAKEITGIKIDKSEASVKAFYEDKALLNESYLSTSRKFTAEIQDRNFNEDNAKIQFTVDGVTKEYTIAQIRNGEVEGLVIATDRKDSEGNASDTQFTNDRKNSYVFEVTGVDKASHTYSVSINYEKNGQTYNANVEGKAQTFTIDKAVSEANIEFKNGKDETIELSKKESEPSQVKTSVKPILAIKEHNFNPKDVVLHITSKDSKGNNGPAYEYSTALLTNAGSWTSDGDTHYYTLNNFTEDANYSISMEYTDLAGNKVKTDTYYFTLDKTAPVGSLSVLENGVSVKYNDEKGSASFVHVSSNNVQISNEADDVTSGIDSVKYYLYHPSVDSKGSFNLPTKEELESFEWLTWAGDLSLDSDQQTIVYQRMEDKAGNVSYVNTSGAIIVDKTAPAKPTVELTSTASGENKYNGDVTGKIHVEDQEAGGTYSGLKTVKVEVLNGDNVTQSKTYEVGAKEDRAKSYDTTVVVDSKLNNSNSIKIKVTATDWAGNVSTEIQELAIDTVAPRIEVNFDSTEAKNGRYFKQARTATVRVYERNFDPNAVNITVNGGKAKVSEWKIGSDAGKSDENVSTATITFSEDGDYTFNIQATDAVGNSSEYKHTDVFTIDKVVPELGMDFVNSSGKAIGVSKDEKNPTYDRASMKAVLSVKERNFDPKDVVLNITEKDSKGQATSSYEYSKALLTNKGSWIEKDGVYTYTLNDFDKDGNYGVSMEYTDLAGNKVQTETYYFTVDKTAPVGSITISDGVEDKEYTGNNEKATFEHVSSGAISVRSKVEDATSGVKSVKYYLHKPTVDSNGEFSIPTLEELQNVDWQDYTTALSLSEDQQAIVYQRMEDKAGNVSYVNASGAIIIDKTAPEKPEISIVTKNSKGNMYNGDVTASIHTEDKVVGDTYSGLNTVKVEVLNNGNVTQSKTYNVGSKQERKRSFDGQITVDSKINNSNNVVIRTTVTDWAGNVTTSEKTVVIDTTAPRIEVSFDSNDAQNGKYYNKPRVATIKVFERNFDPEGVNVAVHGGNATVSGWSTGSQNGSSDENVSTATITFSEDGDYTFEIQATDLAGNSSEFKQSESFVIDKVAPEPSIDFVGGTSGSVTGSVVSDKPIYDRSSMTATLTIKEKNFDPKDVILHVNAANGKNSSLVPYSTSISGAWSANGDVHTYSLNPFTEDANYSISMEYTDLAGNKSQTDTYYFTVDKTAPVGALNVTSNDGAGKYTEVKETSSFEHVTSGGVQISSEADDVTSGIASVKYYLYHPSVDSRGTFGTPSKSQLESFDWQPWSGNLNLDSDQQTIVYQRMEDKAGNISYVNTSGAIIIDKTAPAKPNIEITTPESGKGTYNGDVNGRIHVEDQEAGGTYSGLKTVKVEVLNGDNVTQSQTYEVGSKQDRIKAYDANVTVDSKLNNSNFVKIRVTTTDWAGNVSTGEQNLAIDTVAPRIEVSFDSNDGRNGRYYNKARTATVRVYERNFDPNAVNISINGGHASISGWSTGSDAGVSDENVNIATITFAEDGDYTFDIQATDLAGNSSNFKHSEIFTIDVTKPTVSVSWDTNDAQNGKFYNRARTATITVNEHNFDAAGFTANVKASLESQGISAPSVSGWSSNGDTHTATLSFSEDGDYSFTLDFEDMAGNKADTITENEFTVDKTVPEIAFENVQDHSSYKDEIRPAIRFTDRNFDKSQISLKLKGYRHKEVDVTGSYSDVSNGGLITMDDFLHAADVDDVYTLTAETTDKAGNKTSKTITFSVNRYGSNYFFSEDTAAYIDKFYHNKEADVVIHEVNTDSLRSNGLIVTRDGSTVKLKESDYTVNNISNDGWKEYVYTIKANVFEKEGLYEITVDSEDEAGNKQNNQIKEKPASFIIDKTDPSAVITGVSNGEIYNALERELNVVATDNILVEKAELLLDGKVVKEFDFDANNENNSFTYKLLESNKWQEVQVRTIDAAGNVATSSKLKVLITPDATVRFLNSIWFKLLLTLTGASLLSAIFWFIFKKKKENEEK